jgi:hypothetical protein
MNQSKIKFSWIILLLAAGMMALTGCMKVKPKPGEVFACAKDANITKEIAKEASLENFSCIMQPYEGMDTLHFNLTVKNISMEDQRFKVNIFLSNGKAAGGLLPVSTKKGLIKPGQTETFSYPVTGMDCAPGKIDLIIKTMTN